MLTQFFRKEIKMFRPHIHSVCNCSAHLFPVRMHYIGEQVRRGRWVHVMICPISGIERHYIYLRGRRIRRVA